MRVRSLNRLGRRRGGTMVEAAIVLPILFMFILGIVYIGLAVFRYQQVAELAREGARYASVHGSQYATDTGNTAATTTDIYNYIMQYAVGLDPAAIPNDSNHFVVTWPNGNAQTHLVAGNPVTNTVSVSVTYTWAPNMFYVTSVGHYSVAPLVLSSTSTSVMPMSY